MRRLGTLTLLCACLGAAVAAAADGERTVTDRITVTQVEIAAQVLRRGEPVRGLTAADFEVLDRGEPREIVSFETIDLLAVDGPSESAEHPLEKTAGDERGRQLLVLVDLDLTDWRHLPRALVGARRLVDEQLHPADRVAVGFYSSVFGAQLLTGFLADRRPTLVALDLIAAVIDRQPERVADRLSELSALTGLGLDGEPVGAEAWQRVAREWLESIWRPLGGGSAAFGGGSSAGAFPFDEVEIDPVVRGATGTPSLEDENVVRRVRELGRRLADLARRLAAVPEPKQILFLSEGFPSRFLEDRNHSTRVVFRMKSALKALLETGWILQAIDVRGVPSVGERGFDGNSLFHLAHHSGGQLYENFNRIDRATERIVERSSVTYVLVIQPNVVADGSFHDLEVRLKGDRRADVRHRPGYRAPPRSGRPRRLDDRRDLAELVLSGRSIQDFEVELLAVSLPAAGARARVPIVVEIPGEVLLERRFGETGSLELHAYGLDREGGVQDLFIRRIDIDLDRHQRRLERGGLRLVGQMELGVGPAEVRILVRNLADDALSMARAPLDIAALDAARAVVLPPLFLDRSRDWLSLGLSPEDAPPAADIATLAQLGAEFFPRLAPAFRSDREQRLVLNMFYPPDESPVLELRLLTARGEEIEPPEMRFLERYVGETGATGLVAIWKPKDLEPGRYTLEVALVDPTTGRRATGSQRFEIVEPS